MEKYEVPIPDEVNETLGNLSHEWAKFQHTLVEADAMPRSSEGAQPADESTPLFA